MKYDRYLFFTKKDSLHDYFCTDRVSYGVYSGNASEATRARYETKLNIQLIAMIRRDTIQVSTSNGFKQKSVLYCKIRCPINPLPIKGEFELPSIDALMSFLKRNGWIYKEALWSDIFE